MGLLPKGGKRLKLAVMVGSVRGRRESSWGAEQSRQEEATLPVQPHACRQAPLPIPLGAHGRSSPQDQARTAEK